MAKQNITFVVEAWSEEAYITANVTLGRRKNHELTADEMKKFATSAKRSIALALEGIKWSDFGIENIKIRNKRG